MGEPAIKKDVDMLRHVALLLLEFALGSGKGGGTVVNFWPTCGNSPTVQNAYILVQFVSKID